VAEARVMREREGDGNCGGMVGVGGLFETEMLACGPRGVSARQSPKYFGAAYVTWPLPRPGSTLLPCTVYRVIYRAASAKFIVCLDECNLCLVHTKVLIPRSHPFSAYGEIDNVHLLWLLTISSCIIAEPKPRQFVARSL
jgi:hypothetical protein